MTVKLPNVRQLFVPSHGHIIVDCDLSGADAQVVAWEAEDTDLKAAFRAGLDVHNHNGEAMWGSNYEPKKKYGKYTMRDALKRGVHGTNYVSSSRNLASTLGWKTIEVDAFQRRWFNLHPGIQQWQARTDHALQTTRKVSNRFGYDITYFDRPDNLLPKGLAWIPQSTVAEVASRGAIRIARIPWLSLLLQVHDSVVFELPYHRVQQSSFEEIKRNLSVTVPYPDPLIIPWGIAASRTSWGDVVKLKWEEVKI